MMMSIDMPPSVLKRPKTDMPDFADQPQTKRIRIDDSITKPSATASMAISDKEDFSENMYRVFVEEALTNPESLSTLCTQMTGDGLSSRQLQHILLVLIVDMSRLDTVAGSRIISAVLKIRWSAREPDFVNAYVKFLGVLISSMPKWLAEVAGRIVQEFTQTETEQHHGILQYLLCIIPTASSTLQAVLFKHFPHKSEHTTNYVRYVRNLLKCVTYCPELERSVWALLIEKTVQLDVELHEDDDDEENDEDDEENEDEDDDEEEEEPDREEEEEEEEENENEEYITQAEYRDTKKKLDLVLSELMDQAVQKLGVEHVESGQAANTFAMHLDLFQQFVLPTHRTRTIQYLMFHMCHADPSFYLDAFLAFLIEVALHKNENVERRQKAMQYLSSIVARSRGITKKQLVFVMEFLANWIQRYIREREFEVDLVPGGGMGRFKMFYSVSQALFYIFCFRHSMLRKDDDEGTGGGGDSSGRGEEWECNIDKLFQQIIVTKFNPLRYCKRTVVAMFAQIAQRENAAYCFTIMEQNRLGGIKSSSTTPNELGVTSSYFGVASTFWTKTSDFVMLESYFPFDPLVLRRAHRRIQNDYVEWFEVMSNESESESESADEDAAR